MHSILVNFLPSHDCHCHDGRIITHMYVSYCGIFVKGMVLRYHWCKIFPIEVRKHKCCHKSSTCLKPACTMQQSSPQVRFFLNLVPIDDHLINKTRFHHQGLPNVGVCKVVALSLLVKQSGFLAPLPPLTAPTLFVALLTGSSLAAECENLGCAIIIGGLTRSPSKLPT